MTAKIIKVKETQQIWNCVDSDGYCGPFFMKVDVYTKKKLMNPSKGLASVKKCNPMEEFSHYLPLMVKVIFKTP